MTVITGVAAFLIVAIVGWLIKRFAIPPLASYFDETDWHLSLREYLIGLCVLAVLVVPVTVMVGSKLSVASTLRYEEFYNGVETAANRHVTTCRPGTRGDSASSGRSNCRYQYDTGERYSYTVMVSESYPCTDADGKSSTCTRMVPETHWASIYYPYATTEATYSIDDSLGGNYRFKTTYVPMDAEPFAGQPIPGNIPRGAPEEWQESRDRLDSDDPRPVTRIFAYDNCIMAAKDDMLLPFSQDVERYQIEGILPEHTANIMTQPLTGFNQAFAHKLSFVGVTVDDEAVWQESLMGFNATLGSTLRGDLHMVAIDSALVDDPVTYLNALKAYWSGDDFRRRAIAKNAIIVVVGVQDDTVQWAKASTGMPFGNERMIQGIENFLHGVEFTPEAVIGDPRVIVTPAKSKGEDDTVQMFLAEEPGVLEEIVLGTFPFERACMKCSDEGEGVGYDHLVAKIPPSPLHHFLMGLVVAVVSIGLWLFLAATSYLDIPRYGSRSRRAQLRPRHPYRY